MSRRLRVLDLGQRPYRETLDLQRELCRARVARETGEDLLLLVEHEPVVTLGRGTQAASLPLPQAELERRPEEVIRRAVRGMLPRNRLARRQIAKLKVYAGPDHPHAAQKPEPLEIET